MADASVRAVSAALLSIVAVASVGAQEASRPRFGIAAGWSIPGESSFQSTGDMGVHLQLSTTWWTASRWAARLDLGAQGFPSTVGIPGCAPAGPCEAFIPHPDQLYSATISAVGTPFAAAPRIYPLIGLGAYYGRGPQSKSFGTSVGAAVGAGLNLLGSPRRGVSAEVRYHRLFERMGDYAGVVAPSLAVHF
jgi:hypothetical protein